MQKNNDNKYIRYFKAPLFGVSASTAYNLPNSLVHIPVIVMLVYIGIYICGAALKPLLAVYFVVALYMSRDMVIMSYKNMNLPVAIWSIFVPFLFFKDNVSAALTFNSAQDSITVTLVLLACFLIYIPIYIKKFLKW